MVLNWSGTSLALVDSAHVTLILVDSGKEETVALPAGSWPAYTAALSPDGSFIALVPSSVSIKTKTPTVLIDLHTGESRVVAEQLSSTKRLVFSAAGDVLAIAAENGQVDLVNVRTRATGVRLTTLPGLQALAISRDGRLLAVGADRAASVYDLETGRELTRASPDGPLLYVSFSDDGTCLITAGTSSNGRAAHVIEWNLMGSSRFTAAWLFRDIEPMAVGFDSHSKLLVTTYDELRAADLRTLQTTVTPLNKDLDIGSILTAPEPHRAFLLVRHVFEVTNQVLDLSMQSVGPELNAFDMAVTPDGRAVAFITYDAKGEPGALRVWKYPSDLSTGFPISERASSVAISPHADYVVVSLRATRNAPAEISVYRSNEPMAIASVRTQASAVRTTMSSKSDIVAVADGNTLSLRTLPDLQLIFARNLAAEIRNVTFATAEDRLSVIDTSGTISIFTSTGALEMSQRFFFQGSQRTSVAFSPDGDWLAVLADVSGRGVLHLLPVKPQTFRSLLCEKVLREPTELQWRSILSDDRPPPPCVARPPGPPLALMNGRPPRALGASTTDPHLILTYRPDNLTHPRSTSK